MSRGNLPYLLPRDSDPREPQRNRSLRRPLLMVAKFVAVVIVFPILLGAVVFAIAMNSSRGHAYLINLIQKQAGESLGVPVQLQNLDLHLSTLSVDLYGLTIDGAGPHSISAIAPGATCRGRRARRLSLRTRMVLRSAFASTIPSRRSSSIRMVSRTFPRSKATTTAAHTIFDLGIRHASLANGAVFYNNRAQFPRARSSRCPVQRHIQQSSAKIFRKAGIFRWKAQLLRQPGADARAQPCNSMPRRQPFIYRRPASMQATPISSSMQRSTTTSAPVVQAQYTASS